MTEKRFTLDDGVHPRDSSFNDYGNPMSYLDVLITLNNLAEENEELKTKNNAYLQGIEELKIKNEDLENEYTSLKLQYDIKEALNSARGESND